MVGVPFCFAWIAALLAHGPQPIQDSLRRLRQPPQVEAPVAVVRIPLDAAQWTEDDRNQRLGSLLNLPLLDLTRGLEPSEGDTPKAAEGHLFQLGLHWDGVHRSIRFPRTSPVRPFAEGLGFDPLDAHYDLRAPPLPPEFHLKHLEALEDLETRFSGAILAYEDDWTRARFRTPGQQQDHAGLIASFLNHPRGIAPFPAVAGGLTAVLLLGAFRLKRQLGTPTTWLWVASLSLLSMGLSFHVPVDAVVLATAMGVGWTKVRNSERPSPEEHEEEGLPPHHLPDEEETWHHLCKVATQFGGALAAWAMQETPSGWVQVASSGDATPLDSALLKRLRSPQSLRRPEDKAFLALPVPDPMEPLGFLVLQPKDGRGQDPLIALGGAMKLAAEQIRCRTLTDQAIRALGQRSALRAARAVQATLGATALYDPLGQPLQEHGGLRNLLGSGFDPHASLFETWTRLGGRSLLLSDSAGEGASIETPAGLKIRLETGVHVGTVECYILRAVNTNTHTEGSPC